MIKSWIIYACWLILILALNVFTASTEAFMLLCISGLLPLTAIIANMLFAQSFRIKIELPDSAEKGTTAAGKIVITNNRKTICPFVRFTITSENVLTGEQRPFALNCSLTPFGQKKLDFKLKDYLCGRVVFKTVKIRVYDIFGLTCKKADAEIKGYVNILPEILQIDVNFADSTAGFTDSSDYSADKPGFDLSEPYEHREYAIGDNPKSIHWKLSRKLDRLIVRQGGTPSPECAILLLDTSLKDTEPAPDVLSKTAEIFISLSKSLCDYRIAHLLCFYDHKDGEFFQWSISDDEDWFSVIPKILSASFKTDSKTWSEHYYESTVQKLDRIICVSPYEDESNADVTLITPEKFT